MLPINVFDTLKHLDQERYRAAIFHTSPEKSPSLSTFCQKVCQQANGKYLDLLELFIQTSSLSEKIDSFGPDKLRELLINQSQGQALLMVDRADFLLDTWRRAERQDFYQLITNQWNGYHDNMRAKLVFALQTSQEIEARQILDSQGQSRIFRLTDFNDIG